MSVVVVTIAASLYYRLFCIYSMQNSGWNCDYIFEMISFQSELSGNCSATLNQVYFEWEPMRGKQKRINDAAATVTATHILHQNHTHNTFRQSQYKMSDLIFMHYINLWGLH